MGDTFHSINLHLIFSCKDRMELITPAIEAELYHVIGGILRNKDAVLIEGNGTADHVHLLVGLSPKYAPSDCARDIKANTSRWIHEKWPKQAFAWQGGYSVFSVSISKIARTREYIANQKEHHKKHTFGDELKWFLDNHGVPYDERYLPPRSEGPVPPPPEKLPKVANRTPGADGSSVVAMARFDNARSAGSESRRRNPRG